MDYTFHWRPVLKALPGLLDAALLTLQVAVEGILIGIVLGLCLSLMRVSGKKLPDLAARSWIEMARNTPVLFQLYAAYFGLGALGINLSSHVAMVGGLAFNNAGYLAETFRGGLKAIPHTQVRAARSLGMSYAQVQAHIVLPQMFRIVYHPLTNQFILSILVSSLGLFIGLRELSGETQFLASKSFRVFEYFIATAAVYYVLTKIVLFASGRIARRLFKYDV